MKIFAFSGNRKTEDILVEGLKGNAKSRGTIVETMEAEDNSGVTHQTRFLGFGSSRYYDPYERERHYNYGQRRSFKDVFRKVGVIVAVVLFVIPPLHPFFYPYIFIFLIIYLML